MKIVWLLQDKYFVLISLENAEIGWLTSSHCAILCVTYLQKGVVARQIPLKLCAIQLAQKSHVHWQKHILIHYLFRHF